MNATASPAPTPRRRNPVGLLVAVPIAILILVILFFMWWWDKEPEQFDPVTVTTAHMKDIGRPLSTGAVTTYTLIRSVDTLMDKRGGYLSNDKMPPGVFMDNMPNWEFGSLTASRDLSRALRNDLSRSQTQSTEDKDLGEADPLLNSPNDRWLLPSSESQYSKAVDDLEKYLGRLSDAEDANAHFYARADNLADYLQTVSARLGSLSQRLSAAAGQLKVDAAPNADVSGNAGPARAVYVKTSWNKIDDNFYEARGYTWALLEQLKAIRHDFAPILRSKNADASLQQVIRELEESQKALGSPVVLNGSPFGFFANHSLVMANYISRANAAIIDLRGLLNRG
ncbi:DUF2333 family protein [Luteibacter sp. 9133]|uniref:DUF2333 family protein n=1 Tax=Luteibacter sp. 9133 TaxID=1500891 RepID=UPI0005B83AE9|nr:DUF2333 family protein [Luteibacter sp. 9133]